MNQSRVFLGWAQQKRSNGRGKNISCVHRVVSREVWLQWRDCARELMWLKWSSDKTQVRSRYENVILSETKLIYNPVTCFEEFSFEESSHSTVRNYMWFFLALLKYILEKCHLNHISLLIINRVFCQHPKVILMFLSHACFNELFLSFKPYRPSLTPSESL